METRHEQRICRIVVGKIAAYFSGTDVLLSAVCQIAMCQGVGSGDDRVYWLRVYRIGVRRIGNNARVGDQAGSTGSGVYRIGNDGVER